MKTNRLPHIQFHWDRLLPETLEDAETKAQLRRAREGFQSEIRSEDVGFYSWPETITPALLGEIRTTAKRLREETDGALCFGIGGSHLGPACLLEALRSPARKDEYPIEWLSNADPYSIEKSHHFLSRLKRPAAILISKSGGTTETLSGWFHFSKRFKDSNVVAITDPDSGELRRLAKSQQWTTFDVPKNIGGRFSVLTPVGLFPAELGSVSSERLIQGARNLRAALEKEDSALLFAYALYYWDHVKKRNVHYLMPYASELKLTADWFVQLWAESLGKKNVGFTPVAALGTSDQHSVLQLMKEGPGDKVVGFVHTASRDSTVIGEPPFKISDSFKYLCRHNFSEIATQACLATEKSLQNSGMPTYRIELETTSPESMGGFFFFMETACAYAGQLYGVNTFNQPGVEESKRLLRSNLEML